LIDDRLSISRIRSIRTGGVPLQNVPTPEDFDTLYQTFKAILTHPEFQNTLEEIQNLPEDQRSQAVSTQLATQELAAKGIPIPQGTSIAIHDLESPAKPTISAHETGATPTIPKSGVAAPAGQICFRFLNQIVCVQTITIPIQLPPLP
jgi:hypothetical protein